MPILLYQFRYRHERTGKWTVARYRAELHEIRERFAEFELIGDPEVRDPPATWVGFNPYRKPMTDTLYTLRGRLDDGLSWEQIGYPCPELSTCKADAERFTDHYSCVEVISETTGRVVHRVTRRPIK